MHWTDTQTAAASNALPDRRDKQLFSVVLRGEEKYKVKRHEDTPSSTQD